MVFDYADSEYFDVGSIWIIIYFIPRKIEFLLKNFFSFFKYLFNQCIVIDDADSGILFWSKRIITMITNFLVPGQFRL